MKKLIYIITLLTIISSCTREKKQIYIEKSISFKTGLVGLSFWDINYCYDKNLHKEFVFFADRESFIKSFSIDGNFIDSISLNNYIDITYKKPLSFLTYTKDTILLLPYYTNMMAFINNKGEILKYSYMNDLLEDSIKNDFWFCISRFPYQLEKIDKLYFVVIPSFCKIVKKLGIKANEETEEFRELWRKFDHTQWMNYTYMSEINNFLQDTLISTNLILSDYYKTNFIEGDINSYGFTQGTNFLSTKNNLYLINSCSAKIIIFDTKTHQQIKEVNVVSKYTKVGLKPYYCTSGNYLEDGLYAQDLISCATKIDRMFFNKKTKQHYVILTHELKNIEEWKNYNNGDYRPFSVIIYDENFENPKEYAFAAHTYIARNCFMSQKGLWMQRKPEQLTKENYGTQTFDLLKFN